MKRQHAILILLVILILGVLVFLRAPEHDLVLPDEPPVRPETPAPDNAAPETSAPPVTPPAQDEQLGPVGAAIPDELRQRPEMQAYLERQAFEQAMRSFFEETAGLSPRQREQQAAALLAQVDRFEQLGELSAAEAVTLRLGLLRESLDEQQYAEQSAHVLSDYRSRYEAAMAQYVAEQPPEFLQYKARERDIVREVQQMEQVPDGMTREQYLRQRLQAAREESYAH